MPTSVDGLSEARVAALGRELKAVSLATGRIPESLKSVVCDIVDQLKAAGKKPEEMIVVIYAWCDELGQRRSGVVAEGEERLEVSL